MDFSFLRPTELPGLPRRAEFSTEAEFQAAIRRMPPGMAFLPGGPPPPRPRRRRTDDSDDGLGSDDPEDDDPPDSSSDDDRTASDQEDDSDAEGQPTRGNWLFWEVPCPRQGTVRITVRGDTDALMMLPPHAFTLVVEDSEGEWWVSASCFGSVPG